MFVTGRCNKVSFPLCRFSQLHTHPCCAVTAALVTGNGNIRVDDNFYSKYFKKVTNSKRSQKGQFWADGQKLTLYLK